MDYIVKILKTLFFNIDRVVYLGIGNIYDLLIKLSRTTVIGQETINKFANKIYAFIAIFMLFKITISMITYILNPDEFTDKEKGFASIIKRVVISLMLLVFTPYIFREAYHLQAILLEDNTLANIVFDTPAATVDSIDTAGDNIKFILMSSFFQPNYTGLYEETGIDMSACAIIYTYDYSQDPNGESGVVVVHDDGTYLLNEECFGQYQDSSASSTGYPVYVIDDQTYGKYWENKEDLYQTYVQGLARQNFNLMFRQDIALALLENNNDSDVYLVDYTAPLSTAVGVAVLWVLLMFCLDVAVRSIKLSFFELISPVPILSYIDPKSSKDGMFSKWVKQCTTTYLSLFMRLLTIYLAIFIIDQVSKSGIQDVITGEQVTSGWVKVFMVLAVLFFAKQLPKILEDALGIKGTGDFTLNPLKKLGELPGAKMAGRVLGTGAAIGVAGALAGGSNLVGGIGRTVGGWDKSKGTLENLRAAAANTGRGVLSTFAGMGSAMGRAALGGMRGNKFGKNWASSYGAAMQAKQKRSDRQADGVSWGQMMTAKAQQSLGIHTAGEKVKAVAAGLKSIQDDYKSYEAVATGVDAYAKYASKRLAAAQSSGNYAQTKLWSDRLDQRIKEIAANGGKIVKEASDVDLSGWDRWNATTGERETRGANSGSVNDALAGLTQHMSDLAKAMNEAGEGMKGFTAIQNATNPASMDVKNIKNQAQGSQQGIEYNNQGLQDIDRYASGNKK